MANGDLSRLDRRTTMQDRVTNNRSGILPSRRNTEALNYRPTADMRNARRGDGADELMRILGGFQKAGQQYAVFQQNQTEFDAKIQAQNDTAQAGADALTGQVDADKMEKSSAYRKFMTESYLTRDLAKATAEAEAEVEQFLNMTPEERQDLTGDGLWDLNDVDQLLGKRYLALFQGENGEPLSPIYDSPEGRKLVAERYNKVRADLLGKAHEVMVKQEREAHLNVAIEGLVSNVKRGGTYDVDGFIKALPPQISASEGLTALMTGIEAHADSTENVEGLQALLTATKADGKTPLLGYKDMARLRTKVEHLEDQRETRLRQERSDRHEATMETLNEMFVQGKPPTIDHIRELEEGDMIDARMARTMISSIEAEARERRAEAREITRAAREAASLRSDTTTAFRASQWKSGLGPRTYEDFTAEVEKLMKAGELGTGKDIASNLSKLDGAWRAGRNAVKASPNYRMYSKALLENYKSTSTTGTKVGDLLAAGARDPDGRLAEATAALDYFNGLVMGQKIPEAEAYQQTKAKFGLKTSNTTQNQPSIADIDRQIREAEARKKGS